MAKVPLRELVKTHTQAGAAQIIGVTQAAVCMMLKDGRAIFVIDSGAGEVVCVEEKLIGRSRTIV